MAAQVRDMSIVTPNIAQRNGLKFFEVVIRNWGLTNPDVSALGPIGQSITVIDNGLSFDLPSNLPLAGVAIGPLSTVDQVLLTPDYNGFVGINGLNAQAAARAVANNGGNAGNVFTNQILCSVEAPATVLVPGTISVEACRSHYFRQESPTVSGIQFVEPNNQLVQKIADNQFRAPILQLYCFLRQPGAMGWPTKRAPYFDWNRINGAFLTDVAGRDDTMAAWAISGRKRVQLDVWLLPKSGGGPADINTRARCRVLLHRATGPATSNSVAFDEPDILHSEQIYPAATVLPIPQGTDIHIQEELQNQAGPNKFSVLIDNPMATFMELRVGTDDDLGDVYYNMRAVD